MPIGSAIRGNSNCVAPLHPMQGRGDETVRNHDIGREPGKVHLNLASSVERTRLSNIHRADSAEQIQQRGPCHLIPIQQGEPCHATSIQLQYKAHQTERTLPRKSQIRPRQRTASYPHKAGTKPNISLHTVSEPLESDKFSPQVSSPREAYADLSCNRPFGLEKTYT